MSSTTKRCSKCHETKPVSCFSKNRPTKDGLQYQCKVCISDYSRTPAGKALRAAHRKLPASKAKDAVYAKTPARMAVRVAYAKTPSGKAAQAKCARTPKAKAARDARRLSNPKHYMVKRALKRAGLSGIPCTITVDDFEIPTHCPVLGMPIIAGKGKVHAGSPSLDKIIPDLGYVPGNVEVISHKANAMKNSASAWEIFRFIQYYSDRFQDPDLPVPAPQYDRVTWRTQRGEQS